MHSLQNFDFIIPPFIGAFLSEIRITLLQFVIYFFDS